MSDDNYPLVSAIMLAGRHKADDIVSCVDCFSNQTYPYKELIIVNNAKNQFQASELNIEATRDVFLIDTPYKLSAGLARNYGISAANGRILAQFDADYWHHPQRLELQIAALASEEAHISVLAKTMEYSYYSGIAKYQINEKNAILNTMVFTRPADIDYPNSEKGEELGILNKLIQTGRKVVSLDQSSLACKLYFHGDNTEIRNDGLSKADSKVLQKLLKNRH